MPDFVREFVERERERTNDELLGDSAESKLLAKFLDKLEREFDAYQNEELSPRQAAEESGYTPQAIRILRKNHVIGERRADLPRKRHGVVRMQPRREAAPSIAERVLHRRKRVG